MEEQISLDNIGQKDFQFPFNVKQIGTVDKDLKVFMEDYVYTYLYQHARSEESGKKLAVLVGEHFEKDGEHITLISGAIEGKDMEKNGDKVSFTESSWNHINRQLGIYFKNLCIVGWVHIQPDYGTYLMPGEEAFHRECFKEKGQVLFLMDPSERVDAFYTLTGTSPIRQLRGYFIYYDKNENMQNYMIDQNLENRKEMDNEAEESRSFGESAAIFFGLKKEKEEEYPNDRIDAAKKIRKVLHKKEAKKIREKHRRQIAVAAFCTLLCVMTGAMIGNLLNSNTRLKNIESQMLSLQEEYYGEIAEIIEGITTEAAERVFAQQAVETGKEPSLPETETRQDTAVYEPVAVSEEFMEDTRYHVYWVSEGDNLWQISTMFYGSSDQVDVIMAANGLSDENLIYYGEKLIIPRNP